MKKEIGFTASLKMAAQLLRRSLSMSFTNSNFLTKVKGSTKVKGVINTYLFPTHLSFERNYRGSNRNNRLKSERQNKQLEKELEIKYGVSSKKTFDFKTWIKENYLKEITAFQNRLGLNFEDMKYMVGAFCHASYREEIGDLVILSNSNDMSSPDIEARLQLARYLPEISSDKLSLLGFETTINIIKTCLYQRYKNMNPAICNDVSQFLISRKIVSELASNLGLEDLVVMSRELENVGVDQKNEIDKDILADSLFAFIGAIEMDQGYAKTVRFVEDFILPHLDHADLTQHIDIEDPHAELMKIFSLQGINSKVRARTIVETGVDSHFPFYQVGIFCRGKQIGEGTGHSVSIARTNAFKNTVFQSLENEIDFNSLKMKR